MTPGVLRQVIRQAKEERWREEFDTRMTIMIWSWMAGMFTGLILVKLFW